MDVVEDSEFLKTYLVDNEITEDLKGVMDVLVSLDYDEYMNFDFVRVFDAIEYLQMNKMRDEMLILLYLSGKEINMNDYLKIYYNNLREKISEKFVDNFGETIIDDQCYCAILIDSVKILSNYISVSSCIELKHILNFTIYLNSYDCFVYLIEKYNLEIYNQYILPCLCEYGRLNFVKYYMTVYSEKEDPFKFDTMTNACSSCNLEIINILLENGYSENSIKPEYFVTQGDFVLFKHIHKKYPNLNYEYSLSESVKVNNYEIFIYISNNFKDGHLPYENIYLSGKELTEIIKYYVTNIINYDFSSTIFEAIELDNLQLIEYLFNKGVLFPDDFFEHSIQSNSAKVYNFFLNTFNWINNFEACKMTINAKSFDVFKLTINLINDNEELKELFLIIVNKNLNDFFDYMIQNINYNHDYDKIPITTTSDHIIKFLVDSKKINRSMFYEAFVRTINLEQREGGIMLAKYLDDIISIDILEKISYLDYFEILEILRDRKLMKGMGNSLTIASRKGFTKIINILLPYSSDEQINEALIGSILKGNIKITKILLPLSNTNPNKIYNLAYSKNQHDTLKLFEILNYPGTVLI